MLNKSFLNNSLDAWLTAFGLGIGIIIALRLAKAVFTRRFFRLDQQSEDNLYGLAASLIEKISMPLVALIAVYIGAVGLTLSEGFLEWLAAVAMIAIIAQVAIWGNVVISFGLKQYQTNLVNSTNGERITTMRTIVFIGRMVLVSVAVLLALDNIPGVKITTLIASLGIGGIAVAMAVQNILADLFASLSIVFDKPFVVGDFIIVDTHMGEVEYIGLKTTRIRSLSGEQLIFANNDLLKSRIRNYKRMAQRRVAFFVGVHYETGYEKLKLIPQIIRQAIEAQDKVRFDRSHFQGYGESVLNFENVYYVMGADYNLYMDIQQAINLEIYRRFQEEGIMFAYPTRTLYLNPK